MVLRATIAEYAGVHSATARAAAAETQTATWGDRNLGETLETSPEKGSPPSRAKAKSMRELEVMLERPQNHIASMAIATRAPPSRDPSAVRSTCMNGFPAAAAVDTSPAIASVTTMTKSHPKTALTATERKIPHGALRVGSCVSSQRWALASYPVNVQAACRSPSRNPAAYGRGLSVKRVRRKDGERSCAKKTTPEAMASTPAMWTQAESWLSRPTRRTPRWFKTAWLRSTTM